MLQGPFNRGSHAATVPTSDPKQRIDMLVQCQIRFLLQVIDIMKTKELSTHGRGSYRYLATERFQNATEMSFLFIRKARQIFIIDILQNSCHSFHSFFQIWFPVFENLGKQYRRRWSEGRRRSRYRKG